MFKATKSNLRLATCVLILFHAAHGIMQDNFNVPCKYLDSINITNGKKNTDGSITFDGIRFGRGDYGLYDYVIVNGNTRNPAQPHLRGCPCKKKPCVSLCCPRGSIYSNEAGCMKPETFSTPTEIWNDKNVTATVEMFEHFGYVQNKPCDAEGFTEMDPEQNPTDVWYLYNVRAT